MHYYTINSTDIYSKCRNEQQFKTMWVNQNRQYWKKLWCIETEETVQGFPDVMGVDENNKVHFLEFKITDESGKIKFQPTQPAFYKNNKDIPISVIVLIRKKDTPGAWCHFNAQYLFDGNLLSYKATASIDSIMGFINYHNLFRENEQWR